jgi:hypothetical protein
LLKRIAVFKKRQLFYKFYTLTRNIEKRELLKHKISNKMTTIQEIRDFISKSRLGDAIRILKEVTKEDRYLNGQVIAISSNYSAYKKKSVEGRLSHEQETQSRATIVFSLLYIVDKIEEKEENEKNEEKQAAFAVHVEDK